MVSIIFPNYKLLAYRVNNNHCTIIRPSSQLHTAVLLVKREVCDYNFTVTFKNSWWCPGDQPCVLQKDFGVFNDGKITVCAAKRTRISTAVWAAQITSSQKNFFWLWIDRSPLCLLLERPALRHATHWPRCRGEPAPPRWCHGAELPLPPWAAGTPYLL